MKKPVIRHSKTIEIDQFLRDTGEPAYRSAQIYEWLWLKHATSFEDMTNLSKALRKSLSDHFEFNALHIHEIQQSAEDNTIKVCFRTWDGYHIEGVIIPTEDRKTACISSQIGCSLDCTFCATGKMKRERNLFFDEIMDQFYHLEKISMNEFGKPLSNVVFMGMGEPLLNYKEVLKSIQYLTDPTKRGLSPRRITLSTAGIAKGIMQLGDDGVKFELALSLHATNDEKRSQIMSINQHNHIAKLIDAIHYFYQKTESKITLEYLILKGFNDSLEDAKELVSLYRKMPIQLINIIEYNTTSFSKFSKPSEDVVEQFIAYLQKAKVNVRVRKSRGKDIDAACGQLAIKETSA